MRHLIAVLAFVGVLGGFFYLLSQGPPEDPPGKKDPPAEQLHLTVAVDLSDRIDPDKHPLQVSQDIAAVTAALEVFRTTVEEKLYIGSQDRFAVEVAPQKGNPRTFHYLDRLSMDMKEIPINRRRQVFDSLAGDVRAYLDTLYDEATRLERYWGADLWQYFAEHRVDTVSTTGVPVRNVLIILTDGYLIAENNLHREGCRSNYLNSELLDRFREKPGWKKEFEEQDCGFLPVGQSLEGLEVLVIGLKPRSYFNEAAIIRAFWSKWMEEMRVDRFAMYPSCESPAQCKTRVERFLNSQ